MVRINNDTKTLMFEAQKYIKEEINFSIKALIDHRRLINQLKELGTLDQVQLDELKADYIQSAKTHGKNAVKMYRWFFGKTGITIPQAFTDVEVDEIDPDIRTTPEE